MLQNQQCDAILFASRLSKSELVDQLPASARVHFESIPRIAFSTQAMTADVQFQMGLPGINEAGEHCRVDNVSMPIRKIEPNDWIPPEVILEKILRNLLTLG
jgi:formylmethanofuran dehydrogenase subunit B